MTSFYHKYRPRILEEVLGQSVVTKTLKEAFLKNKLAHAYLFCGPRGTGKTSTARILAKMVNCHKEVEKSPCNKCSSCLSIGDGSSLDLVEMDAASNRGIDDIRSLRENIKLAPTSSKKKVYIIDEVHMLTGEAFNAILKTLEEPPSHVLFILATTEVQKIPPTILSRVQRLDFKLASSSDIIGLLRRVAKEEKIKIDEEGINALAKRASGSFRDGVKLLDQLSTLKEITQKEVEQVLGESGFDNLIALFLSIAKGDSVQALTLLGREIELGVNSKELCLGMLLILRNLLYIHNGLGERVVKAEVGGEKFNTLLTLSSELELARVVSLGERLQKALEQLRYVSIPTLPLELLVVESCLVKKTDKASSDQIEIDKPDKIRLDQKITKSETAEPADLTNTPISSDLSESSDIQKVSERWNYILETVRQYNYSLEALLRSVKVSHCGRTEVGLEVPYSFHQRILEAPKSRDILESILSDILGRTISISTSLGQKPQRKEEVANIEVAEDDEIIRIASEIFSSDSVN